MIFGNWVPASGGDLIRTLYSNKTEEKEFKVMLMASKCYKLGVVSSSKSIISCSPLMSYDADSIIRILQMLKWKLRKVKEPAQE